MITQSLVTVYHVEAHKHLDKQHKQYYVYKLFEIAASVLTVLLSCIHSTPSS